MERGMNYEHVVQKHSSVPWRFPTDLGAQCMPNVVQPNGFRSAFFFSTHSAALWQKHEELLLKQLPEPPDMHLLRS